MHYVYAHYVDNKPVYIGKGKGNRHLAKRSYDDHTSKILEGNLTEDRALELELWLINLIGVKNLRNIATHNTKWSAADIYSRPKHTYALRIFDLAAEGDMDAIRFIAKKIPDLFNKVLLNNNIGRNIND